jgi:oligoribonuclease NrnB/cAMP/cGMP phosphodiesterase (DHH superfamily)
MRLLTRPDFDGVACGAVLKETDIADSVLFVHPKDVQDGLIEVSGDDVLANVPYADGCGMWFDHHKSEIERVAALKVAVKGEAKTAPSAARIVYEYYGGRCALPHLETLIHYTDKLDSGRLTIMEISESSGWVLLGFILDPRTGLGRVHDFQKSAAAFAEHIMESCRVMEIDEIMDLPDVKERVNFYNEQSEKFTKMIEDHTKTEDNVIITDLRGQKTIYAGNRFMIYGMYPKQNVALWITDGRDNAHTVISAGYSVINRSLNVDISAIMADMGGGGHEFSAACVVPSERAEATIADITRRVKQEGGI